MLRFSNLLFRHRVLAGFLLALAALSLIAFFTYRSILGLVEESGWVSHTHEVLETVNVVFSDLKDAQSAQRGYVITGHQDYLAPYEVALPSIRSNLETLATLISDNPHQIPRVAALRAKTEERLAVAAEVIRLYDTRGPEAAVELVRTGRGKKEMDEIRLMVAEIEAEERRLLDQRQERATQAAYTTLIACGSGLVATFAILLGLFAMIRRENVLRLKSEASLQEALARTEQITADTRRLGQMGDFLQGCRTQEEAHVFIAQILPQLFAGSAGALALLNNSHDFLETVLNWGQDDLCAVQFTPDECWALRRGKIYAVEPGGSLPCPHVKGVSPSSVCVPMMAHGETMGVLYLAAIEPGYLDEYRMEMVRTASEQISLALANLKLQETLRVQSIRDPLTKLFNRRYMEATLIREFSRARRDNKPISVLMIDVDHFKRFNDTHGHEAGDIVLGEVGRMLQKQVRGEDIPCRYGGEEFIVVLLGATQSHAAERAELIRKAASELTLRHERQVLETITLSIGVATYPENGEQSETVIAAADAALYQAKRAGRNRVAAANAPLP